MSCLFQATYTDILVVKQCMVTFGPYNLPHLEGIRILLGGQSLPAEHVKGHRHDHLTFPAQIRSGPPSGPGKELVAEECGVVETANSRPRDWSLCTRPRDLSKASRASR